MTRHVQQRMRSSPGFPGQGDRGAMSRERALGHRVRERRASLGITRKTLAGWIGVSAQQIEKYETGENRLFARRLWDIATALGDDIDLFFEEAARTTAADARAPICLTEELSELLGFYAAIRSGAVRGNLLALIEAVAAAHPSRDDSEPAHTHSK